MGMPVLALATTEAVAAVPPGAGVLSTRVDTLVEAARRLARSEEPGAAAAGLGARALGPTGSAAGPLTAWTGSSPTGTGCWRRRRCASR